MKNEDFYFPNFHQTNHLDDRGDHDIVHSMQSDGNHQFMQQNTSLHGDVLFLMADGHAGHEAPIFFIKRISQAVLSLLNERRWNFGDKESNAMLQERITLIYSEWDDEYTRVKITEYQEWVKYGSDPSLRPCDDGCTMILNIIQPRTGWLLNCNVGDSRTVLAKSNYHNHHSTPPNSVTSNYSNSDACDDDEIEDDDDDTFSNDYDDHCDMLCYPKDQWDIIFASIDHNMTNPYKVYSIHQNGGKFLDSTGSIFLYPTIEHPFKRIAKGGYPELSNSRLFRPLSDVVRGVGCSHRRTLNLSGTLGDLLFKIHPPVLVSTPDFSFIKLKPGKDHLLVIATDGIWDHLSVGDFMRQNDMVMEKVTELMSDYRNWKGEKTDATEKYDMELSSSLKSSSSEATMSSLGTSSISEKKREIPTKAPRLSMTRSILEQICMKMVNREPREGDEDGLDLLYSKNLMRYDDATMMLVHIEAQQSASAE